MDQKEVIWSIKAKEEFYTILDFYINRNGSPAYSLKLLSDSENITELLKNNYYLGRLTENRITRVIVKDAYLIFMKRILIVINQKEFMPPIFFRSTLVNL